jgi:acetyltransferase-like isoleucine patch superfamily enzyme
MFSLLKKIIYKMKLALADEFTKPAIYSKYLGVTFGKNVRITGSPSFGSEPYLITIGDNVTITLGVVFHNHDGGVGVLRSKYPGIDIIKPIRIGNNVFIGSNATIMPGVTVGDNVIIGASSVVSKDIPDNVVSAGVPAKVIKTLGEYEEKALKEAIFINNRSNPIIRKKEIIEAINSNYHK